MINRLRWWFWRITQPAHRWVFKWFKIDCHYLLPRAKIRKRSRRTVFGVESSSVESELYFRPDKPPNPAKKWNKFAYNCEKLEGEGKIPKVDDHVDWAIKEWEKAGYST